MLAARTAQRYGDSAVERFSRAPSSSFGHGAAGIAWFLWRYGSLAGEPSAVELAERWIALAEAGLADADAFVGAPPVFPDSRTAPSSSVLFGEAGVWWAGALVHAAAGKLAAADRATGRFCALAAGCPDDALDVASGAAGLLLGAAALVERLGPSEPLVAAGDALARRLDGAAESTAWLGAAHGSCGVAHAGLRWCQATARAPGPALTALLDSLREARLAKGVWPRRRDGSEVWPGWCHGSAGWAQLWVLAAEVLGDIDLLALAEPPAVHALIQPGAGAGLCCGLSGQAYAGLAMYRATGEATWLTHAQRLAADAAQAEPAPEYPAHSLWNGDVGAALLALDVADPRRAAMPLYCTR